MGEITGVDGRVDAAIAATMGPRWRPTGDWAEILGRWTDG